MFCLYRVDTTFVLVMRTLFNREKRKRRVVVAVSGNDVEVGSVHSVVLKKIGVSARKLGFARLGKGDRDAVLVKSSTGKAWSIRQVELLTVSGRESNRLGYGGFKVVR